MNDYTIDTPARGSSAVFEARECTTTYSGINRRRGHRRDNTDRRQELRFELDKPDRRKLAGRRKDDKRPSFW
jgi:hypothetical protein